jgi:hypothetical protein
MHQQYQALAAERERDRAWITAWQIDKLHYDKKNRAMQRNMVTPSHHTSSTTLAAAN